MAWTGTGTGKGSMTGTGTGSRTGTGTRPGRTTGSVAGHATEVGLWLTHIVNFHTSTEED